jgi:type II secretory pathway predicted ATPase ExeA
MYEAFFQLHSRPFPAVPVVANYFPSQSMEVARQNLIRAVERTEGPGVVIGPAGVGKTLLLRVLADHFASAVRVVVLSGTRVATRKSLLQTILFELQMPYRGMDEGELRLALIDALRRNDDIPNGILLLIDEAHVLPLRLLDEARLITNVVHDGRPRVSLVLAGNPQLDDRFTNPKLDSFNQRIAARCYLQPFSRDETYEYVRAEISWAGGDADAIISDETARAVFRASDGIPRIINQVCDHALVMAQALGRHHVDAGLIQESWADLQQLPPPWQEQPVAASAAPSTVIEFGQLEETGSSIAFGESDPNPPVCDSDPCVAQNDSPCEEAEVANDIFQTDIVLVNAPFLDEPQWTNCGEQAANVKLDRPTAPNPFSDTFDEEIVVIDRLTAQSTDGFRGRPRVSCAEGREIVDALIHIPESSGQVELPTSNANSPVLENYPTPAFEFSTLQDLPEIDSQDEFEIEPSVVNIEPEEQVELDFDEDVDCVPLPWTRGSLGDDRDIIIVEEETPAPISQGESPTNSAPRSEYRELFAQLRRASN